MAVMDNIGGLPIRMRARGVPAHVACGWCRVFQGCPDQAPQARRFVRYLLAGSPLASVAEAVTGELVSNAILHTRSGLPGGLFVVNLARGRHVAVVSVVDQGGPADPALAAAAAAARDTVEAGRGLITVAALAARWGWYGTYASRTVRAAITAAAREPGTITDWKD